MVRAANTGWMEKISASFPVRGVSNPPIPYASPIIRLEAMDFPAGASFCAKATASGRVARIKIRIKRQTKKSRIHADKALQPCRAWPKNGHK